MSVLHGRKVARARDLVFEGDEVRVVRGATPRGRLLRKQVRRGRLVVWVDEVGPALACIVEGKRRGYRFPGVSRWEFVVVKPDEEALWAAVVSGEKARDATSVGLRREQRASPVGMISAGHGVASAKQERPEGTRTPGTGRQFKEGQRRGEE